MKVQEIYDTLKEGDVVWTDSWFLKEEGQTGRVKAVIKDIDYNDKASPISLYTEDKGRHFWVNGRNIFKYNPIYLGGE